jgi:hypothetical protein
MRTTQRSLLPTMLPILIVGSLVGCTQQRLWDDYASKTETMKFLAFTPCDAWFVSVLPEHQMYSQVTGMSANADGSYRVEHQQQSQWVFERIYFSSVHYIGLRDYTAISTVWIPSNTGAKCAALVVLPWSSDSKRPFFYQEQSLPRATAVRSLAAAAFVGIYVFILMTLLYFCAIAGYSRAEIDGKVSCLIFSTAVVLINASVWCFNFFALSNIDALASFYEFYDALPRSGGHLLPLPWSQAHRLFDGPPYPTSLIVNDGLFWIVFCVTCAAWLAAYVRRIVIGIAYATMSDPFEDLRLRLAAEGRLPTPEEYLSVLMQVGATASTWELELLKRMMREWCPDA